MLSSFFKPKKKMKIKGVKVWSTQTTGPRIGIGAKSLEELNRKIRLKFDLGEEKEEIYLFLQDGTEIDDEEYYEDLDDQVIIYLSNSPKFILESTKDLNPIGEFLSRIRQQDGSAEIVDQIKRLLYNNEKWEEMTSYIKNREVKTKLSHRNEDPQWFEDLSTNAQTKEEYLTKGCQSRIRGYLAKAESGIKSKLQFDEIFTQFRALLKNNKYNGHYFDRQTEKTKERICDENGQFRCEGRFDQDNCKYGGLVNSENESGDSTMAHFINPYESSEARILFSTWNLDHVIERSRTIVPALIEAVEKCPKSKEINVDYFYKLLFTRNNLKLVHIVCHDKQVHCKKKCDTNSIYRPK